MNKRFGLALGLSLAVFALIAFLLFSGGPDDLAIDNYVEENSSDDGSPGANLASGASDEDSDDRDDASKRDAGSDDPSEAARLAERGAVLHGVVADSRGRPLPRARVFLRNVSSVFELDDTERYDRAREIVLGRARSEPTHTIGQTLTDREGRYAIALSAINPGAYRVHAVAEGFSPDSESWSWTAESSRVDFRLTGGETIAGVVVDPDGNPVPGAYVTATTEDRGRGGRGGRGGPFGGGGSRLIDETKADSDGRFVLNVYAGSFRVDANADPFAEGSVRRVSSGTEIEVELEPGRSITGRVVDASGAPLSGVALSMYDGGSWGGRFTPSAVMRRLMGAPEQTATSDSDGRFQFLRVEEGDFTLLAERASYVTTQKRGDLDGEDLTVEMTIEMARGRVLAGRVEGPDGSPIPKALIVIADNDSAYGWFGRGRGGRGGWGRGRGGDSGNSEPTFEELERERAEAERRAREPLSFYRADAVIETDSKGEFLVDTLSKGTYAISVQAENLVPRRETDIDLDEENRADVEIVLDSGLTLKGDVVSSIGQKAIPEAVLMMRSGEDRRTIQADDRGKFSIGGLSPGATGSLQVSAEGYTVTFIGDHELDEKPREQELRIELDPNASVSGRVVDPDGNPVVRATVDIAEVREEFPRNFDWQSMDRAELRRMMEERRNSERARTRRRAMTRTDGDGRFEMLNVTPAPNLRLEVDHAEFKEFESAPFALKPNEQRADVEIVLPFGGRIIAVVTAPDGSPLNGVRVSSRLEPLEVEGEESDGERRGRGGRGRGGDRGSSRTTGIEGTALFAGIDPGRYRVWTTHRGFQPFRTYVEVGEDRETRVDVELLAENAITGVVQDPSGNPIAEARLRARRETEDGSEEESWAQSGPDGSFRIGTLGPGAFRVEAYRNGYRRERIEEVAVNSNITITMTQLGEIRGTVVSAGTGEPLREFYAIVATKRAPAPATLEAGRIEGEGAREETSRRGRGERGGDGGRGPFGRGGFGRGGDGGRGRGPGAGGGFGGRGGERGRARRFRDDAGKFVIDDLEPGDYTVEFLANGHTSLKLDFNVVSGPATQEHLVELDPGLSISGIVTNRSSSPIPGARVILMAEVESEDNNDGRTRARSAAEAREAMSRRREGGGRRRGGDSDEDAKEAAKLLSTSAKSSGGIDTDNGGEFRLRDVPEGQYALLVYREGFLPHLEKLSLRENSAVRSREIRLDPGEKISGKITVKGARDQASLVELVFTGVSGLEQRIRIGPDGRFRAQGFLAEQHSVRVLLAGVVVATQTFDVEKKANRFDFELEAEK